MNIKLFGSLIVLSTLLYGCSAKRATPEVVVAPLGIPGGQTGYIDDSEANNTDKTLSDGSHLLGLPMTRDFIMDSRDNFQAIEAKGSKKIFSIKPTGAIKPRAVVLLENRMLPSSGWKWQTSTINPNVRRKNIDLCRGFMKLPTAEAVETSGKLIKDDLRSDRKNHVISYMPAVGLNRNNLPDNPEDCNRFITNGYDYASSAEELSFILGENKLGKSPYLALYESRQSPYSSMILSLGSLSPDSITLLASNWPELITKVYSHGDSIDPTIGIAVMLSRDPSLQEAQKKAVWKNIKMAVSGLKCGAEVAIIVTAGTAGTAVTPAVAFVALDSLVKAKSCKVLVAQATYALGYEKQIPTPL